MVQCTYQKDVSDLAIASNEVDLMLLWGRPIPLFLGVEGVLYIYMVQHYSFCYIVTPHKLLQL